MRGERSAVKRVAQARIVVGALAVLAGLVSTTCSSKSVEPAPPLTPTAAPADAEVPDAGLQPATTGTVPDAASPPITPIEAYLKSAPACVRLPKSSTLDLEAACARGACVGMTMVEVTQALGPPKACDAFSDSVSCRWDGVSLDFGDTNHDGVADLGSEANYLSIDLPFNGSTGSGLGLGVSMRCFAESYGEPVRLSLSKTFTAVDFGGGSNSFGNFSVYDFAGTADAPDGRADTITIFQPFAPTAQSCRITGNDCSAERPRCAATRGPNGLETTCKPSLGSQAEGEVCTKPTNELGIDNCAPGLYCSAETAPAKLVCRRYCQLGDTCGAGEACVSIDADPVVGRCLKTCTVFGSPCLEGLSCTGLGSASVCAGIGPKALGEACNACQQAQGGCTLVNNDKCQLDLQCIRPSGGAFVCSQMCDPTHPCKVGSCTNINGLDGYGFCGP